MKHSLLAFALGLVLAQSASAVTVYYQPTPYPLKKADGTVLPQDLNKIHIIDGWMNSYYPAIKPLQRDDKLRFGGWGDWYRSYMNMDLTGLPKDPTTVNLWMRLYPSGSATTPFRFCIPNVTWDSTVAWDTQPTNLGCTGYYAAPTTDTWYGWSITSWYQNWQSGAWGKFGFMIDPQYNTNTFTTIRSSRYADFVADPTADGKRPMLQFDFTPTLQLKMPLPAGYSWLLTNEAGGYECSGRAPWPDNYHDDTYSPGNYFSLDFSWRNKLTSGQGPSPYGQNNTPILAAAAGVVNFAGGNATSDPNGFWVVIDHDYDNDLNTGFQTRYLHMNALPVVVNGNTVSQGQILGYMGNTGISTATHLHFGVRYQNKGLSTISELTKVLLEGKLIKSYQTECSVNSSGWPTDWIRYYPSN